MRRFLPSLGLAAVALLVGHVTDKTTGQPLAAVNVRAAGPGHMWTVKTDRSGRFRIPGLAPGRYVLTLTSKDVPAQKVHLTISASSQSIGITVCSMTLDYSCGTATGAPTNG